jgi:hypothetical protein
MLSFLIKSDGDSSMHWEDKTNINFLNIAVRTQFSLS